MGERFRIYASTRHSLQTVVAYRGGGLEAFVNVSRIQNIALLSGVAPNAGQAVGLQFKSYGKLVSGLRVLLLRGSHFAFDAQ